MTACARAPDPFHQSAGRRRPCPGAGRGALRASGTRRWSMRRIRPGRLLSRGRLPDRVGRRRAGRGLTGGHRRSRARADRRLPAPLRDAGGLRLRRLPRPLRDRRQRARDAEAAASDPGLRPHGPPRRQLPGPAAGRVAGALDPRSHAPALRQPRLGGADPGRFRGDGPGRRQRRRPVGLPAGAERGDAAQRQRWGLGSGPIVLSVGGFEARKNTATIIEAFALLRAHHPRAQLVIAGGASLLDHASYRPAASPPWRPMDWPSRCGEAVIETGPVPQADMPALYRVADVLAFPSWRKASASACSRPWPAAPRSSSRDRPPFTEYLAPGDALFVDPADPRHLARAMAATLVPTTRATPAGRRPRARRRAFLARLRRAPSRAYAACARVTTGADPCLRCASPSAGPTAGARAATRPPWSCRTSSRRARATPLDDFVAKTRAALEHRQRSGARRNTASPARRRWTSSPASRPSASGQDPEGRVTVESLRALNPLSSQPPRSESHGTPPPRHVPVAIVGGGQAGLSVSYHLKQSGIDHLVFEKHTAAHTWSTQRWDTFCLVTPNWQCDLPGHPYDGPDPRRLHEEGRDPRLSRRPSSPR